MSDFAKALFSLVGKDKFITIGSNDLGNARVEASYPQLDWTNPRRPKQLVIQSGGTKIALPLSSNPDKLPEQIASLSSTLTIKDEFLIGWGIKPLYSYVLAITGQPLDLSIWDLKIMESFLGIKGTIPKTAAEARRRFFSIGKHPSWNKFKILYREIYQPLITRVIPGMETTGLVNRDKKLLLHSFYELDGQANGRSKTLKVLNNCYLPHSMTPQDKEVLFPQTYGEIFMEFDYSHMEVSVLQWLSGDPMLGEILTSGKDVYEQIWYKVAQMNDREKGKSSFLPVVYGLGKKGLAKKLEISEDFAAVVINKYYNTFQTAFSWIRQQSLDVEGVATDYFGRKRQFDETNLYKSRNFLVQAPANIICLKKLITLQEKTKNFAKLAFHVHDGFCILIRNTSWREAYKAGKEALETEDNLFKNLHLTVHCKSGVSLKKLRPIG